MSDVQQILNKIRLDQLLSRVGEEIEGDYTEYEDYKDYKGGGEGPKAPSQRSGRASRRD